MPAKRGKVADAWLDAGAQFSPCRKWRYRWWRTWDADLPALVFVGLNPSTADESKSDPTVTRCIGYARREGCGGVVMLNLFAWKDTDPKGLKLPEDPVGPDNDDVLARHFEGHAGYVVACWGSQPIVPARAEQVLALPGARQLRCFGFNADGQPKHPLYLRADCPLRRLFPAAARNP